MPEARVDGARVFTFAKRGVAYGAAAGAVYFIADLVGALLAVGSLTDGKPAAWLLIGAAAGVTMVTGAGLGALISMVWSRTGARRWTWQPGPTGLLLAGALLAAAVVPSGYATRVGRTAASLPPRPRVSAGRPVPILWVSIDTLRADTLYGDAIDFPLTPALRDFASRALVFTDAESAAGWTIPSVATLLTGIHPEALYSARRFLPDWAPTVATRLRAAGYATHALVDNTLLERRNGFAAGFDTFAQRSAYRFAFTFFGFRLLPDSLREGLREALPVSCEGAPAVTDRALDLMATPREAPLFLWVHYMDVHHPYYPHPELGPDPSDSSPIAMHVATERLRADPSDKPTDAELRFLTHRYRNGVRALDPQVGRLLTAWQERFPEGMVVVTADHGEEFLDHGELGHGQSLYRELVHVPLMMLLPRALPARFPPGTRLDTPVGLVDVLPTTLDAASVSPDTGADGIGMQGASWLPWLTLGGPAPQRPVFASQGHYGRRIYRWREANWALLATFYRDNTPPKNELFDVTADPHEHADTFATRSDIVASLVERKEPFMRAQEKARDPKPVHVSEDREGLRALGYVQ